MTLDMFLAKLYEKYRIIIGPTEYRRIENRGNVMLANSFQKNLDSFQDFLKATGFLRELSDATSIVENPYDEVGGEA